MEPGGGRPGHGRRRGGFSRRAVDRAGGEVGESFVERPQGSRLKREKRDDGIGMGVLLVRGIESALEADIHLCHLRRPLSETGELPVRASALTGGEILVYPIRAGHPEQRCLEMGEGPMQPGRTAPPRQKRAAAVRPFELNHPKDSDFDSPGSCERQRGGIRPLAGAPRDREIPSSKDVGLRPSNERRAAGRSVRFTRVRSGVRASTFTVSKEATSTKAVPTAARVSAAGQAGRSTETNGQPGHGWHLSLVQNAGPRAPARKPAHPVRPESQGPVRPRT